jgi:monofunctional chorismate mutase, gram positive type, clade 1
MMEYGETFYALRGANTVETDSVSEIDAAVKEMFESLMEENDLEESELGFVLLSQTSDLKSRNAAAALRKGGHCSSVPLFCVQEAEIDGMLEKCVRVMLAVNHPRKKEARHCYLGRSANLRPDLKK